MSVSSTPHPRLETLRAFGLGLLPPDEMPEIETHITECDECCEKLRHVGEDTLLGLARAAVNEGSEDSQVETSPATSNRSSRERSTDIPPELKDHSKYRIIELIGQGGMGVVYKAEHRVMERIVALKVIARHLTARPEVVARFRREVRTAGKLGHTNIVTFHDAEQEGELHFLVMEYVEGVSLAKLIEKRGFLTVFEACKIIRQAAMGLQHAHERGMVHRDIKPQNLMVTKKGVLKILDFGLIRFDADTDADELKPSGLPSVLDDHSELRDMTKIDTIVGTPDYLAPEQARSSKVDIRADLYALGCTFYSLLTGHPPFPGGSAFEKVLKHSREFPQPVGTFRPDVPPEVVAILNKLMAKSPDDRYQVPNELVSALTPYASRAFTAAQSEVVVPPPPPSTRIPRRAQPVVDDSDVITDVAVETPTTSKPATKSIPKPGKRKKRKSTSDVNQALLWRLGIGTAVLGVLAGLAIVFLRGVGGGALPTEREEVAESKTKKTAVVNPVVKQPAIVEKSKSVLIVVPPNKVWWPEYHRIHDELERAGFTPVTASITLDACTSIAPEGGPDGKEFKGFPKGQFFKDGKDGKDGNRPPPPRLVQPDITIGTARAVDYAALVFCGANVRDLYSDPVTFTQLNILIGEFLQKKKPVGAICTGQALLIATDRFPNKVFLPNEFVLEQLPSPATKDKVKWDGNESVRIDPDGIILARHDRDSLQFVDAIVSKIAK